jgi:hypothetical protein
MKFTSRGNVFRATKYGLKVFLVVEEQAAAIYFVQMPLQLRKCVNGDSG